MNGEFGKWFHTKIVAFMDEYNKCKQGESYTDKAKLLSYAVLDALDEVHCGIADEIIRCYKYAMPHVYKVSNSK